MEKKTEMIGFKTTLTLKKELERIAKENDRSLSYIINKALEEYIKKTTA